jgi:VanZ family protein
MRTRPGAWLLGQGLGIVATLGILALLVLLRRRRAAAWAYAAIVVAGVGYAIALSALRANRLERTHLVEYGVAAWLAWRALAATAPGEPWTYAAAAVLASAIGYGDELLQAIVPGRYYDLRDVAMNAAGALLGTLVIAALHAGEARHKGVVPAPNAEIASPGRAG